MSQLFNQQKQFQSSDNFFQNFPNKYFIENSLLKEKEEQFIHRQKSQNNKIQFQRGNQSHQKLKQIKYVFRNKNQDISQDQNQIIKQITNHTTKKQENNYLHFQSYEKERDGMNKLIQNNILKIESPQKKPSQKSIDFKENNEKSQQITDYTNIHDNSMVEYYIQQMRDENYKKLKSKNQYYNSKLNQYKQNQSQIKQKQKTIDIKYSSFKKKKQMLLNQETNYDTFKSYNQKVATIFDIDKKWKLNEIKNLSENQNNNHYKTQNYYFRKSLNQDLTQNLPFYYKSKNQIQQVYLSKTCKKVDFLKQDDRFKLSAKNIKFNQVDPKNVNFEKQLNKRSYKCESVEKDIKAFKIIDQINYPNNKLKISEECNPLNRSQITYRLQQIYQQIDPQKRLTSKYL